MFQHLLIPVDGTELSERALQAGLDLAQKLGASVTAFVAEPFPPMPAIDANAAAYARDAGAHVERTNAHAQALLDRIGAKAREQGVTYEGRFHRSDQIDIAIVEAAKEYGCDLIVMATHGRGAFGELLFGSHTKNVLARCKLPLLVLH